MNRSPVELSPQGPANVTRVRKRTEALFCTQIPEVDLDAWFKLDRIEAYKDGEAVMSLLFSLTPCFFGHSHTHVGVRKQRRTMVPLCALRRPLLAGDHVQAFFAKSTKRSSQMQASEREESEGPSAASTARKGEWVNALVLQPPAIHLSAHATTFHILLEEEREPGRGRRYDMMLSQLQRRYLQGDQAFWRLSRV
ncbi:unnamed protein product [Symbiodinium sp. CCMP2456]|nr:unnamed protein product [Symbiodinium sp. CCMP2456]